MKILIIAGHGAGDPGAVAKIDGVQCKEAEQTRIASDYVCDWLNMYATADQYDPARNAYYDYQNGQLKKRANFTDYDYVLELHFNAGANDLSGDGETTGVEIFYPSAGEKSGYEGKILDAVSKCGFTRRPVKSGNLAVINTAARAGVKANLLEICFLDDADDMELWSGNVNGICGAIADAIVGKGDAVKIEEYSVPLKNIDHIGYIPMVGKGEAVTAAAKRKTWNGRAPDAICNAELFNMKTFSPASGVVHNGKAQYVPQTLGVALRMGKDPVLSYMNNVGAADWLGTYPMLVRDGKKAFETVPAGLTGSRARTAFAWNDKRCAIVWATSKSGVTLDQLASGIIALGYKTAVNFDGGGSTAVVTPTKLYEQGRKVRGKLGIWVKGGTGNYLTKKAAKSRVEPMQRESGCGTGVKLTVTAKTGLNVRRLPVDGAVQETVAKGQTVTWYGYYCKEVESGAVWYYVQTKSGKTGYASAKYLRK